MICFFYICHIICIVYIIYASLAQLVEHFRLNWEVLGSNPGQVQWVDWSL